MELVGFENLHVHTHMSLLDGVAFPRELGERAVKNNQKYLVISDHGMQGAIPEQIRTCDKYNLNPIFGCELYYNAEQPETESGKETKDYIVDEEQKKRLRKSYHLIAIASNNTGYKNLVKLSSWGWTRGYYYRPRINEAILNKYKNGIIFSSACYNSEIGQALDKYGEDAAMEMVAKYKSMLGDNFFLEMMMLDFDKQKNYDVFLIKAHEKFGIPLVITTDSHYANPEDWQIQRDMLLIQTNKTITELENEIRNAKTNDELPFELQDRNLWYKSELELDAKWEKDYKDVIPEHVYIEAKRNTLRICEKSRGVILDRSMKLPKIENADQKLLDAALEGFKKRNLPRTKLYSDRIKEEYNLITQKEFASYFLIQKQMTDEARRHWSERENDPSAGAYAVGPGRGSAGGSLIAYCLGITDVNPLKHDLLFSRFLSPARGGKQIKLRFKKVEPIKTEAA